MATGLRPPQKESAIAGFKILFLPIHCFYAAPFLHQSRPFAMLPPAR